MGQYHISYVYVSHYLCMRHLFIYMRENRRKEEYNLLKLQKKWIYAYKFAFFVTNIQYP